MKFKIGTSQLIAKILLTQWSLNQVRQWVTRHSNPTFFFLIKKQLKYFNEFQNLNFSILWVKWAQTMEMKQYQTFYHETCSYLTSYTFLSKNIKVFQWLWKSKFLSFMTKVNSSNRNETKSFFHGIYSYFFGQKLLKVH